MKKRILALALAGTTAFSVFGATMSVNAAAPTGWPVGSAHVLSSNDVYKEYTPVAVSIDTTYNAATPAETYQTWHDDNPFLGAANVEDSNKSLTFGTNHSGNYNATNGISLDADINAKYDMNDWKDVDSYLEYMYPTMDEFNKVTIYGREYGSTKIEAWVNDDKSVTAAGTTYPQIKDAYGKTGYSFENVLYYSVDDLMDAIAKKAAGATTVTNTNYDKYEPKADAINETGAISVHEKYKGTLEKPYTKEELLKNISQDNEYTKPGTGSESSGTFQIGSKGDNYTGTWTFDGSTSADTTIYPWTVDTHYTVVDGNIQVDVNEAVSNPTVYLFDFLPFNGINVSSAKVAAAYNAVTSANETYIANPTAENKKKLEKAISDLRVLMGNNAWVAETGDGTSYGIRAEVVDEYEDFLSELVLLRRYGDYTVSWTDFKDEYNDQFVSGYYYNPYTGLATNWKWTTDLYNLSELLDDIYQSSVNNAYLNMNTSELMYLMQQYDKYVGYIDKAEVSNDEWGDLLVSILENVAEDDFKKAADYKTFSRKAEDAIDAYNYAETSSMIKTAERRMYDLIISAQTKSTGAADAQDELGATVNSLFFNAKSADKEYLTAGIAASKTNADLTNFAYIAAVTTKNPDSIFDEITLEQTAYTTTGYYSLYPAADYKESGNTAAQFPGNDAHGSKTGNVYNTSYVKDVTDEYEWFLNVYELAAAVNKVSDAKSVNGIVSAVNDALVSAVDNLAVTNAATATANSALDEMIEYYEEELDFYVTGNGVNEDDFNETYYDAYTKALEIADAAEGAYQVAFARRMVAVAGEALTYQGAQTTVTKTMITDLNEAITSGKTALDAIKNSDDYNAAQVTALNKAIAQAQDVVDIYNGKYSSSYNKVNHASVASVGDKDGIVASDITGAIDAIDAAINYSEIIMGWSKNDADKWMYGTEEGYLNNGWNKIGSVWYYFNEDGTAKQSEWFKENGKWYWLNSNCGAATGWAKVDGEWYFFKGNNAMKTGWEKVDGNWYYMASSGKMVTGWCEVNGKWYYFSKASNSLGQMLYSTTVDGYKLGADGAWIK